ncbi:hypothetical protein [Coxiella-like endosymbiont]|uniref:hypothetical protein n=1 Tax=Coxiella-like endosymbiont TaxID=1592897 RepID=UPI00272C6557|nr:hypothetical protein [Coxiella-like endosymbiont]
MNDPIKIASQAAVTAGNYIHEQSHYLNKIEALEKTSNDFVCEVYNNITAEKIINNII